MCGICGFNWKDETLVDRMAECLAHRGPDQRGVFVSDHWSLGHRRLSIIDLSEHGRQPMSNEDGTIQVVFNGEIFNFAELKDELVKKGHQFIGHSDTEVIVHGYEEYGMDIIQKFRGMFGIAIVDLKKNRLLLVRDRLGIKPIYYYWNGDKIIFASEIKAILQDPIVPRRLNRQALYDYLGFEFVPAPETMFEHIYKLPAGHTLVWENGRTEVKPYWDLKFPAPGTPVPSEGEVIEHLRHLLDECIKYWLVSDVPVAAFLSGGLDSSCVVAFMRKHIPGKFRTFTIGYPDKTFSELDYAKVIANRFGTEHSVLMISDLSEELVEQSIWHFDEPMTDLSSIPLMLLCQEARKCGKVCMSGEGGDEVFCGYDRFKASKINEIYNVLPKVIREQIIGKLVMQLRDRPEKKGPVNLLKRFIEGSLLPSEGRHLRWQYFLNPRMEDSLFNGAFKDAVTFDPFAKVCEYETRCTATDRLNRELYLDTRYEMADSVLMKVDKMSMSCALEVRVPLLDHELVEYMAIVPGNWKLSGFQTKAIFRKALQGILPENIIYRGKQGYSLPVKHLLRGRLKDYLIKLLNETPVIRDNMNMRFVNQLIREHLEMKHNHNHVLWGLMNTAIWYRKFFKT